MTLQGFIIERGLTIEEFSKKFQYPLKSLIKELVKENADINFVGISQEEYDKIKLEIAKKTQGVKKWN